MRLIAMLTGPVFYALTMVLLHPLDWFLILIGLVATTCIFVYLDRKLP